MYASELIDPSYSTNILIVDDDSSVIRALHKVLRHLGNVRFASNGAQAFEAIDELQPDIILLDIMLPDMSGVDICEQLKSSNQARLANIPILFITSAIDEGFEETVFEAGAADFILKPLNPSVVLARVQIHLNYQHAIDLLHYQARIDSLSTLHNRRAFDEQLSVLLKQSVRTHQPLTLLMIDIDEFKKFNDQFGHQQGDFCIQFVANEIKKVSMRPLDCPARFGGDEFAIILPETDRYGGKVVAERLRSSVESFGLRHAANASRSVVTLSIGATTIQSKVTLPILKELKSKLVALVDEALYLSKSNGRNSVSSNDI
ncbi:diguanylate cyclase domain-containing protein [Vibrio sp. ECSMB14106]|uniref:diguanylate cyclase domain-containing protein n=1 Tax=Vibrio sp. ECSMB14106 TaxID=1638949 RepID=UPI000619B8D4|nr:diguanylate cyclase [Vibrio sp. ECSMB14106]